jgi:predicted N-formylglutamate amidohydrolase
LHVLISCEVGGVNVPQQFVAKKWRNVVPAALPPQTTSKRLTAGKLLPTLSCDESASYVVQRMAEQLQATIVSNPYSPELINVAVSPHSRELFPVATRRWSAPDRSQLIEEVYEPYRSQLRRSIQMMLARSATVLHLSVRTFPLKAKDAKATPRRTDLGLLYDPASIDEVDLCLDWIDDLYDEVPMLRVRRNYPQRGTGDCITKAMRTEFAGTGYLGIEMLLNQAWVQRPTAIRDEVIDGLSWTLQGLWQATEKAA